MVRLKFFHVYNCGESLVFQFHYGSIKIDCQYWVKGKLNKFQFHYGSIKISSKGENNIMWIWFQFHYGSIKIKEDEGQHHWAQAFQFHYGSIKMQSATNITAKLIRFNSTMVRLKLRFLFVGSGDYTKFQFHYGSIKISVCRRNRAKGKRFQFHYGSIKIKAILIGGFR